MKDEIREKMKIKRRYFANYQREYADSVICNIFLENFSSFDSYFIYNSFLNETDTKKIIDSLLKLGKKVYLPRVENNKIVVVPYGETRANKFGIEEPCGKEYRGKIEVTVIPLLAINSKGYRIGYGKGYYDIYLENKKTLKIGLGYDFQREEFKEDKWDEPCDLFISEKGIYYYGQTEQK